MQRTSLIVALALLTGCSDGAPEQPLVSRPQALAPCSVDPARELLVLDVSVVEDPVRTEYPGAWSFGRLFETLAGAVDVDVFIESWLTQFDTDLEVNGFKVHAKELFLERVLGAWKEVSAQHGVEGLDLSHPPFRLLGIANRIDLRESCHGQVEHAGEGRFIFGFIDPSADTTFGEEILRGTMIIEYHLPAKTCADVLGWANDWHALGQLPLGSPEYNAALQAITDRFTASPKLLAQVRTNELIDEFPWQWREFQISAESGLLEQTTVAGTPDLEVNGTPLLARFVNENEAAILALEHEVPLSYRGQPFRGGSSDGDPVSSFFAAPGIQNNEARHKLSLTTCVGCHTTETGAGFFQVGPRALGQPSVPSQFLSGGEQADPIDPKIIRKFNDLKRRADDLCSLLGASCASIEAQKRGARVH
jgi:hypothetical protein